MINWRRIGDITVTLVAALAGAMLAAGLAGGQPRLFWICPAVLAASAAYLWWRHWKRFRKARPVMRGAPGR